MTREILPDRRKSWIQKVKIDGQTFYLDVGEYPDGRPGEIFLDVSKYGSFTRGMCDAFARMTSLAIQQNVPMEKIIRMMTSLNFPPNGQVIGSPVCSETTSVPSWIAAELGAVYMSGVQVQPSAGFANKSLRSGA